MLYTPFHCKRDITHYCRSYPVPGVPEDSAESPGVVRIICNMHNKCTPPFAKLYNLSASSSNHAREFNAFNLYNDDVLQIANINT